VLPKLATTAGVGPGAVGVLFACYALSQLAVTPFAGLWVDRAGPRQVLLMGLFVLAAATGLFAAAGTAFWLLVLARVLQGVAAGLSWVAGLALIAAVTPFQRRGQAMGICLGTAFVGLMIGPALGGFLTGQFGRAAPFVLAAVATVAGLALAVLLTHREMPANDDPAGPLAVLRVPGTMSVITIMLLSAATIGLIEPVLPLHLTERFGASPALVGLLFTISAVVGALASPVGGSLIGRVPTPLLVAAGTALSGLGLLGLGVINDIVLVGLALVVLSVGSGALLRNVAATLIGVQGQRSQPPALGASFALLNLAFAGGLSVGPLLGGLITDARGFPTAMVVSAVIVAVLGLASMTRLPATPAPDERISPIDAQADAQAVRGDVNGPPTKR